MNRRTNVPVKIGNLILGSHYPVVVQTMWDRPLNEIDSAVVARIQHLEQAGCRMLRFSILDTDDIATVLRLRAYTNMPLVADIHFNYRLAVAAVEAGFDKIRINPGNIGAVWKTKEIITALSNSECAVRIGINGGSLPAAAQRDPDRPKVMKDLMNDYIELFEIGGIHRIVASIKDSDPRTTYDATLLSAAEHQYPLHLGITEAGPLIPSLVKSAFYLGKLLEKGIGDTLRVSITGSLTDEVRAAREILRLQGSSRQAGVKIISCPRCGRATFDSQWFMEAIQEYLDGIDAPLTVAVMGCSVNGPGEAAHADIAITGLGNKIFIYRKGSIVAETTPDRCIEDFSAELQRVIDETSDN